MKIKNSSAYPTKMLRRMLGWVCKQYKLPARSLREVRVTKTTWYYRGRAWRSRRILLRINANPGARGDTYPHEHTYGGRGGTWPKVMLNDPMEALVFIAAHEVCHIDEYRDGVKKIKERVTDTWGSRILQRFKDSKEALLAQWYEGVEQKQTLPIVPIVPVAVPVVVKERTAAISVPTPTVIEKRAAKAASDLARWQRKLKLAKSKVRKYQSRVNYYSKKGVKHGAN